MLSCDWGFYYAFTGNLEKVRKRLPAYERAEDRADIAAKIEKLLKIMMDEPKTMGSG